MNTKKIIDEELKNAHLRLGYEISFPIYNILPDEVKLSLAILAKHGMMVSIVLKPLNEPPATPEH